ncbi:MAG: pilus assembly protein PilW, partial [Gammaproteobacteria bacterium]|nr:pilus assembly protein PilW [Gammaproteobacteria bacterium]
MRQLVIKRNLYSGMTLVEIMIALVLSLVLIGGIITVFIANKATFRSQEGLAQLQENGRMALSILTNDIRNAGYGGCDFQKAIITNTLNNSNNYVWNFTNFIDGFESTSTSAWEPALDVSIS